MSEKRPDTPESSNRLVMNAKDARRKFRLRPSKETLSRIKKRREAQTLVYERLKDTLLG